jgi:hypothetical protein
MVNKHSDKWIYLLVFYLASGFTCAAVFLRSRLAFQSPTILLQVGVVLLAFHIFFLILNLVYQEHGSQINVYRGVQTNQFCLLFINRNYYQYDYSFDPMGINGLKEKQNLNNHSGIAGACLFFNPARLWFYHRTTGDKWKRACTCRRFHPKRQL